jgi:hypothetical protein
MIYAGGSPNRARCGMENWRVLVGRMLSKAVAVERASTQWGGGMDA